MFLPNIYNPIKTIDVKNDFHKSPIKKCKIFKKEK